jgi:hypothetical protein
MHPTGSFLLTVLERVRAYLDDPDVDAKYSNDFVVRNMICPALVDVMSRLNMNREDLLVLRHTISLIPGVHYYQIPPCIQEVWRLGIYLEDKLVSEVFPRGHFNPRGPGWRIEGPSLFLDSTPLAATEVDLEYIHNGDMLPHYATNGLPIDYSVFQLSASPQMGAVDRRPNGYAGQTLRILNTTGEVIERTIRQSELTPSGWWVRTRVPIWEGTIPIDPQTYEVAPAGSQPLYDSIALGAAMRLGVMRRLPQSALEGLRTQYRISMKTISDNLANLQARRGKSFDRATVDNPMYTRY